MKIEFWHVGKTTEQYVRQGIELYTKRIAAYYPIKFVTLSSSSGKKKQDILLYKKNEGELILKRLDKSDYLVLLDERGKTKTSVQFATWLQQLIDRSPRRIIFLIGGAYGFSDEILNRAQEKISLSTMTFPHQLVRIIFLEQLYRACTILHNKSYHH